MSTKRKPQYRQLANLIIENQWAYRPDCEECHCIGCGLPDHTECPTDCLVRQLKEATETQVWKASDGESTWYEYRHPKTGDVMRRLSDEEVAELLKEKDE